MKKLMTLVLVGLIISSGCTANVRSKAWGGTSQENLPKGQKLITATWKDADLWVLTKPMSDKDVAETYTFREYSSYGIVQGKVIFHESK